MKWDLDRITPRGPDEVEVPKYLKNIEEGLESLKVKIQKNTRNEVIDHILDLQKLYQSWYQLFEYVICLRSIDTTKEAPQIWLDQVNQVYSIYKIVESQVEIELAGLREQEWKVLRGDKRLAEIRTHLEHGRGKQLSRNQAKGEAIFSLEADGLHAWGDLHQLAANRISFMLDEDELTAQNALSTIYYGSDRVKRVEGIKKWKEAWQLEAPLCAKALNHIAGFRLNAYKNQGMESSLEESLHLNRMNEKTLDAMWNTVLQHMEPFYNYIRHKHVLFKEDHLCWTDQFASLPQKQDKMHIPFKEGIEFIENHLKSFDENLAAFTRHIVENHWIDALPSESKSPGAFCAAFPIDKESRILMHYNQQIESVGVLAHEIGHAYHYKLLQELPMYRQDCPMVMAEIASTLTETIVMRAAIEKAEDDGEKLHLLNQQLVRDLVTIVNSYIRHQFEVVFYDKRTSSYVSADELNMLMECIQKEVMNNLFDTYEPTFWASLRHFYFTHKPFGHYPYTVAHLISNGLYQFLMKSDNRGDLLKGILLDTSVLSVEEFIKKYTGMDAGEEEFWLLSLEKVFEDIEEFIHLSQRVSLEDS
ncbi:M3 family metallopeptidase [Alkalihalophilus marmarensis]|uniref:M3 family metallopeptidase n=1 Tax=Alkalihalophilus marmarensis TaxID=521377 RepID=UPI002DBD3C09|nr:M3 family metallopeptidase [Alkalihalophilus marmarensis]MEC2070372.1 M3 family metallopeptidase [Alkalihalophilus marmarensis]